MRSEISDIEPLPSEVQWGLASFSAMDIFSYQTAFSTFSFSKWKLHASLF